MKSDTRNKNNDKGGRLKQLGLMLCNLDKPRRKNEDILIFHNCENLFYPSTGNGTNDEDFSTDGKRHWTLKKYKKKIEGLASAYSATDNNLMPSIIGVCEIENDTVLDALANAPSFKDVGYRYIHYPSQDLRGIDVAMLYNPKRFTPLEHYVLPSVSTKQADRTRDVLFVKGTLGKLTLDCYVVHAPSRRENNIKKHLREEIFAEVFDHIRQLYAKGERNFIVMGDFNDNPWDNTVCKGFSLKDPAVEPKVYDLMMKNRNVTGSYVYGNSYLSFDQFVVSKEILQRIVYENKFNKTHVFKIPSLMQSNSGKLQDRPLPTYKGLEYQGGISDHFPIIMKLSTK